MFLTNIINIGDFNIQTVILKILDPTSSKLKAIYRETMRLGSHNARMLVLCVV